MRAAIKTRQIAELATSKDRQRLARELAPSYQADNLLVFLKDDQVGLFLPAAGFAQNLRKGAAWQRFLAECNSAGRAAEELFFTDADAPVPVLGVSSHSDAVLVLVGPQAAISDDDVFLELLPLLAWSFNKERLAESAEAHAALAREKELSASLLAESLDKARAKLAAALVDARRAEDALRLADQRKDEFLAILAHELRNPLAPISNGIELLRNAEKRPQLLPQIRRMMNDQLRYMARLIDDLMDVSRITRGKVHLKKRRVVVQDVLDSAIEATRGYLEQQQHELVVARSEQPVFVDADSIRLAQVFANLLNNAARYTRPGGTITVTVEATHDEVTVAIRDTGVGLSAVELEKIFDMFVQVDRSTEEARGGLGIGLTLVKKLVELHQGHVSASSEGKGLGSEFTVSLPLDMSATQEEREVTSAPLSTAPFTDSLRVLVVDDNRASAETLGMLVEALGHQVDVVFRGRDALTQAGLHSPQVVLLDIDLPDLNGYEVCRRLRQLPTVSEARIVAQTGWGQAEDRRKAFEAGFDDFLVKPVDISRMHEVLTQKPRG
jgi:signal transduction histidine kinase/CheY-like chemotaxis protein